MTWIWNSSEHNQHDSTPGAVASVSVPEEEAYDGFEQWLIEQGYLVTKWGFTRTNNVFTLYELYQSQQLISEHMTSK